MGSQLPACGEALPLFPATPPVHVRHRRGRDGEAGDPPPIGLLLSAPTSPAALDLLTLRLGSCTQALCTVDFSLHIAYQSGNIEGFPRYYICDGVKWMPIHFNHQIWNNFELP